MHRHPHVAILGAGGIGGTVGGLLHRAGVQVTLVARGEHLRRLQTAGLRLRTPKLDERLAIPATNALPPDTDIIFLAVKAQDTRLALDGLPRHLPVVSLQNGVDNEVIAHGLGHETVGAMVWVPAVHLEPGVVVCHGAPIPGAIDVGAYPRGHGPLTETVADLLRRAGFDSAVTDDIMALKRAKLLTNLAGGLQAACGTVPDDLLADLIAEARAAFDAFDLPIDTLRDVDMRIAPVDGVERPGGSTWQSVKRSIATETHALHAPIVRLARRAGLECTRNARLPALVRALAVPGQWTVPHLRRALDPAEHSEFDTPTTLGMDRVRDRLDEYMDGTHAPDLTDLFEGMLDDILALAPDNACALDVALTATTARLALSRTSASAARIDELTTAFRDTIYSVSLANALSAEYAVESHGTRRRYLAGRHVATEAAETGPGLAIELRLDPVVVEEQFDVAGLRALLAEYAADDPALTVRVTAPGG